MNTDRQKYLRVVQLNTENLFLFLDSPPTQDLASLSEKEWQALSTSMIRNKPLEKCRRLGEALLEMDADFLLLNEVGGSESLDAFNRVFLGDRYTPYLIEGNSDRGIDVGYLVKKDLPLKYFLVSHKRRPLHFLYPHEILSNEHFAEIAPEKVVRTHFFSRDCLELRVFRPGDMKPALVFLLVHLKSKLDPDGIDPRGAERRAAELRTLLDIYQESREEWGCPMIVGGDFNGLASRDRLEPEMRDIYDRSDLIDALELAGRPLEERYTQLQIPRQGPVVGMQLDYLFLSPDLHSRVIPDQTAVHMYRSDLGVVLPYPTTMDQRVRLPSDHYPVCLTLDNFLF